MPRLLTYIEKGWDFDISFLSKKNPVASDNMPSPHFILGTYTEITSQPTDFCVRLP